MYTKYEMWTYSMAFSVTTKQICIFIIYSEFVLHSATTILNYDIIIEHLEYLLALIHTATKRSIDPPRKLTGSELPDPPIHASNHSCKAVNFHAFSA